MYLGFESIFGPLNQQLQSISRASKQIGDGTVLLNCFSCLTAPTWHNKPKSVSPQADPFLIPPKAATPQSPSLSLRNSPVPTNDTGGPGSSSPRTHISLVTFASFAAMAKYAVPPHNIPTSTIQSIYNYCTGSSFASQNPMSLEAFSVAVLHLQCTLVQQGQQIDVLDQLTIASKRHLYSYLGLHHAAKDRLVTADLFVTPSVIRLRWALSRVVQAVFLFYIDEEAVDRLSLSSILEFADEFNIFPHQLNSVAMEKVMEKAKIRSTPAITIEVFWEFLAHLALTLYADDKSNNTVLQTYCTFESRIYLFFSNIIAGGMRMMEIGNYESLVMLWEDIPEPTITDVTPDTISLNIVKPPTLLIRGQNLGSFGHGAVARIQYQVSATDEFSVFVPIPNVAPEGTMAYLTPPPFTTIPLVWDEVLVEGNLTFEGSFGPNTAPAEAIQLFRYYVKYQQEVYVSLSNALDEFAIGEIQWGGSSFNPVVFKLEHTTAPQQLSSKLVGVLKDVFLAGCSRTSNYNKEFLHEVGWDFIALTCNLGLTDIESVTTREMFRMKAMIGQNDTSGRVSLTFNAFIELVLNIVVTRGIPADSHEVALCNMFQTFGQRIRRGGPPIGMGQTMRRASQQVQNLLEYAAASSSAAGGSDSRRSSLAGPQRRMSVQSAGSQLPYKAITDLANIMDNLNQDWEQFSFGNNGAEEDMMTNSKLLDTLQANRQLQTLAKSKDDKMSRNMAHESKVVEKLRSDINELKNRVGERDQQIEAYKGWLHQLTRNLRELESYITVFAEQVALSNMRHKGVAQIYHELCRTIITACVNLTSRADHVPTPMTLKQLGVHERNDAVEKLVVLTAEASARLTAVRSTADQEYKSTRLEERTTKDIRKELEDLRICEAKATEDLMHALEREKKLQEDIVYKDKENDKATQLITEYKHREVALRMQLEDLKTLNNNLVLARERRLKKEKAARDAQEAQQPPPSGTSPPNPKMASQQQLDNSRAEIERLQDVIVRLEDQLIMNHKKRNKEQMEAQPQSQSLNTSATSNDNTTTSDFTRKQSVGKMMPSKFSSVVLTALNPSTTTANRSASSNNLTVNVNDALQGMSPRSALASPLMSPRPMRDIGINTVAIPIPHATSFTSLPHESSFITSSGRAGAKVMLNLTPFCHMYTQTDNNDDVEESAAPNSSDAQKKDKKTMKVEVLGPVLMKWRKSIIQLRKDLMNLKKTVITATKKGEKDFGICLKKMQERKAQERFQNIVALSSPKTPKKRLSSSTAGSNNNSQSQSHPGDDEVGIMLNSTSFTELTEGGPVVPSIVLENPDGSLAHLDIHTKTLIEATATSPKSNSSLSISVPGHLTKISVKKNLSPTHNSTAASSPKSTVTTSLHRPVDPHLATLEKELKNARFDFTAEVFKRIRYGIWLRRLERKWPSLFSGSEGLKQSPWIVAELDRFAKLIEASRDRSKERWIKIQNAREEVRKLLEHAGAQRQATAHQRPETDVTLTGLQVVGSHIDAPAPDPSVEPEDRVIEKPTVVVVAKKALKKREIKPEEQPLEPTAHQVIPPQIPSSEYPTPSGIDLLELVRHLRDQATGQQPTPLIQSQGVCPPRRGVTVSYIVATTEPRKPIEIKQRSLRAPRLPSSAGPPQRAGLPPGLLPSPTTARPGSGSNFGGSPPPPTEFNKMLTDVMTQRLHHNGATPTTNSSSVPKKFLPRPGTSGREETGGGVSNQLDTMRLPPTAPSIPKPSRLGSGKK